MIGSTSYTLHSSLENNCKYYTTVAYISYESFQNCIPTQNLYKQNKRIHRDPNNVEMLMFEESSQNVRLRNCILNLETYPNSNQIASMGTFIPHYS